MQGAWLAATWPFVREQLPAAPSTVLEIGCGSLGGFVPALLADGYIAIGVDPVAPDEPAYRQHTFEQLDPSSQFQCVVGSASLHHVDDIDAVVDRIDRVLAPGGTVIVVEWAWERFDEATAQWCFARLAPADQGGHPTWLHRHQERWHASGVSWDEYFTGWVDEHQLHPSDRIVAALDTAFDRRVLIEAPYFFAELADTSEEDERAAIDAGHIRPASLRYAARSRRAGPW